MNMQNNIFKKSRFKIKAAVVSLLLLAMCAMTWANNDPSKEDTPGQDLDDTSTTDPIAIVSGNNRIDETDIVIPCPLMDINLSRSYNSKVNYKGNLGHKWMHSYEWALVHKTEKYKNVTGPWMVMEAASNPELGNGNRYWFKEKTGGTYEPYKDDAYTLSKLADGSYLAISKTGVQVSFTAGGRFTDITHPGGQSISMQYTSNMLVRVEHSNGQYINLNYNEQALLASVQTPDPDFTLEYSYNANAELTNVVRHTSRGDYASRYFYDNVGSYDTHLLTKKINPNGDVFKYKYSYYGSATWARYPELDSKATSINSPTLINGWTLGLGRESRAKGMNINNEFYESRLEYTPPKAIYTEIVIQKKALSFAGGSSAGGGGGGKSAASGGGRSSGHSSRVVHVKTSGSKSQDKPSGTTKLVGYTDGYTDVFYKRGDKEEKIRYNYDPESTLIYHVDSTSSDEYRRYDSRMNTTNNVTQDKVTGNYFDSRSTYDALNNVLSSAVGYNSAPVNKWLYTWNPIYQTIASVTDPDGKSTQFSYTNALLTSVKYGTPGVEMVETTLGYTPEGLLDIVTNANGHTAKYLYNSFGYATSVVPQVGPVAIMDYTELGMVKTITMPGESGPRTTSLDIDEMGRVYEVTYPMGLSESFKYDSLGNVTNHIDTAGRASDFTYYPTKKLKSVKQYLDGTPVETKFEYNQQFDSLRIIDALGREVEAYALDIEGRPLVVTNVEDQVMTINYAIGGMVSGITRFDGTVLSKEYDSEGRLAEVVSDGLTSSYKYSKNGSLIKAANENGSISNNYDAINRLASSEIQVPGLSLHPSVTYSYYPAGQVSNVVSAAGEKKYSYDEAERLIAIQSANASFNYAYNEYNGLVNNMVNDSGLTASYAFDELDRVTNIVWRNSEGTVLAGFAHQYNNASMITNITRQSSYPLPLTSSSFSYDSLDRLIGETTSSDSATSVVEYRYDLVGNRTQVVRDGVSENYTLGSGNKLTSWGSGSTMSYDLAGNVTEIHYDATRDLDIAWNSRYQVESISVNGTLAESYKYDAYGRQISVASAGATEYHIYDGLHVVADLADDGSLKRSYTYGTGIDNLLSFTDHIANKTYYMITDHLGSVHAVVDEAGNVVESYRYDAWGRVSAYNEAGNPITESAIGNRYLWQGREYSWKTAGLYYFRARWYDPVVGRWLSKDPIGISGGLNQYEAFANCPVVYSDPFGLVIRIPPAGVYSDADRDKIMDALAKIYQTPLGAQMLNDLWSSKNVYTIKFTSTKDGFGPNFAPKPEGGGDVYYDPCPEAKGPKDSKGGTDGYEPFIGLGHEFGHAWAQEHGLQTKAPDVYTPVRGTTPHWEEYSMALEEAIRQQYNRNPRGPYWPK